MISSSTALKIARGVSRLLLEEGYSRHLEAIALAQTPNLVVPDGN
ncbi:MAG: hypothetical protein RL274_299 [Pseudomonadota bacterium]|jgi:hypothetical protein